ncbi:MAG: hypothetical protein JWL66_204 [Sphingomonadales bacterium]|nr:hypothetical protein [Sphingomonadales bacterium]
MSSGAGSNPADIILRLVAATVLATGFVVPAVAQTSCNATNMFKLDWDTQPTKANLGTGARVYAVTNAAGATVNVTMSFAGDTTHYIDSGFGQTPNISVQNSGGITSGEYTLFLATTFGGYSSDIATTSNVAVVRFGFGTPVREVTFKVLDVDYAAGQFRDWVRISGTNGASYVPAIATPYGRNNSTNPGLTNPGVTYVGPGTNGGYAFPATDGEGTAASSPTQDIGNLSVQFAAPITQAEIRYGNGPSAGMNGTAGVQSISVHDISFCPMPVIGMTKTSSPVSVVANDPNRFNIPGADVDYTITVTNTGGSTVDLSTTLVADSLPVGVTFYNGDIDTATAGVQNYVFVPGTSGLTLGAANVTYQNAANASVVPVSGYDTAVRSVRWLPQGTMAANSSFSIRFRTSVN